MEKDKLDEEEIRSTLERFLNPLAFLVIVLVVFCLLNIQKREKLFILNSEELLVEQRLIQQEIERNESQLIYSSAFNENKNSYRKHIRILFIEAFSLNDDELKKVIQKTTEQEQFVRAMNNKVCGYVDYDQFGEKKNLDYIFVLDAANVESTVACLKQLQNDIPQYYLFEKALF